MRNAATASYLHLPQRAQTDRTDRLRQSDSRGSAAAAAGTGVKAPCRRGFHTRDRDTTVGLFCPSSVWVGRGGQVTQEQRATGAVAPAGPVSLREYACGMPALQGNRNPHMCSTSCGSSRCTGDTSPASRLLVGAGPAFSARGAVISVSVEQQGRHCALLPRDRSLRQQM